MNSHHTTTEAQHVAITADRYANAPRWQEQKIDARHRSELQASFDADVSDDWMEDLE